VSKDEHPVIIRTPAEFVVNALKGVLMGIADVVPGVSGGTIALVMGIYDQLITTITRVDSRLVKLLGRRQISEAASHLNLTFILSLGPGILIGLTGMSAVASSLLEGDVSSQFTFSAFFGMIAASAYLVIEMFEFKTSKSRLWVLACMALGLFAALAINQLQVVDSSATPEPPSRVYIFACAAIAICAMILPGISGSMILMILGIYHHLVKLPKNLFDDTLRSSAALELVIFACGAVIGLMLFSRFLKWLLEHFRNLLLATLTGVMLGALPVLFNAAFEQKALAETTTGSRAGLIATVIAAGVIMIIVSRKATAITTTKESQHSQ